MGLRLNITALEKSNQKSALLRTIETYYYNTQFFLPIQFLNGNIKQVKGNPNYDIKTLQYFLRFLLFTYALRQQCIATERFILRFIPPMRR